MNPRLPTPSTTMASCAIALGLFCAGAEAAQSAALDRASLWIGAYAVDTTVRVDASHEDLGTGSLDFAHDDETIGRARLDLLVGDHQGFSVDWYALDHASTNALSRPFAFEGIEFEVDAALRSDADFSAATAAWHWWLGEGDDVLGIGLGAAWYRLELALAGTALVEGHEVAATASVDESAIAPLLTLAWKHAFNENLRVYAQASGIRKNGGALSGHIHDARVGIEWFPWRSVGLGAEYGTTRIRLDREGSRYSADLDIDLDGPALFARVRF